MGVRLLLMSTLLWTGCGPKLVVEPVFQEANARVELRRTVDGDEVVPRGYEHPATISDVRLAHILASLNYETPKGEPRATIRTVHVYELAEGLALAFTKAGPDDEIAAAAFSRDPRLGIFTDDRVTSFRAYLRSGQLFLEFFAVEKILEDPGVANESSKYKIPKKPPTYAPRFRLTPGEAMALTGQRTIAIDWRSAEFRKPLTLTSSGIQRRTILMEEVDDAIEDEARERPAGFTDAQIRALDQLDAARRSGLVTEAEFQRRRRLIVEGRMEDAGYPVE
jgi:hypothetical protein